MGKLDYFFLLAFITKIITRYEITLNKSSYLEYNIIIFNSCNRLKIQQSYVKYILFDRSLYLMH